MDNLWAFVLNPKRLLTRYQFLPCKRTKVERSKNVRVFLNKTEDVCFKDNSDNNHNILGLMTDVG